MKIFEVSFAAAMDGCLGICLSCGNIQSGSEPDSEGYPCEECESDSVMGIAQAVMSGLVRIKED